MDPEDAAEAERRVKAKRRAERRAFNARVETWIRPPKKLDADVANDLASLMGRELYAVYANQLKIEAIAKEPEAENMKQQAVNIREQNKKMLVKVVISAQFGSKWEGDVEIPVSTTAEEFLAATEEISGVKLKAYTVSFNGRLLRRENVLFHIGVRDGKKVVLIPMGSTLNDRPAWSLRQSEQVPFKMEERHKNIKLSESTQNLMKGSLGKKLYNTIDTTFNIVDKDWIDPNESDKARRARELKAKKVADAQFDRTDIYQQTWESKPHAQYKKRNLRPLAGFTTDQAKLARASRPLQNFEESMAKSNQLALMGKHDPAVPKLDSLKQWYAAYGEPNSFFKAGVDASLDATGKFTASRTEGDGFTDLNPLGVMSRFEQSRRSYGKDRSQVVFYKKGNLAA